MTSRLLIVSSIRWGYLWQRHQALAVAAAEDGWQVDFLQPRPRTPRQVAGYPFRMLAGSRVEQHHGVLLAGVRVLGPPHWLHPPRGHDLALVYLPDRLTELLLHRSAPGRVVYDAVLDWSTVPRSWYPPVGWRGSERRLAARADVTVTTDSAGMTGVLAERGIPATVVAPAADPEFVRAGARTRTRRPAALYFGSVRDEVDVPALTALAAAGVPVDVVGRIERADLRTELETGGVTVHPPVPVAEIAERAAGYAVVLLPYRGGRSASLVPAKYWNCVATGSWVVVSGLRDIAPAANVLTADGSADGLVTTVRAAMDRTPPTAEVPTWADRWRELLDAAAAPELPR